MITQVYGEAISSLKHTYALLESVYIVHVYKNSTVYLQETAVILKKGNHIGKGHSGTAGFIIFVCNLYIILLCLYI